ncbi:uncharacterized protein DNG_05760 [Cephalotrichum gorgonifer]|uniref:Arrestin C-terminal-like domain-containing protein n=1 Tax=Cephalotrichum gorgonifer TaxID=2041049 RepID=A0AAE8N083_9PEZI|nr:uncharacterized protein DNG_05760 [Cephalotrichum gorgonifer]
MTRPTSLVALRPSFPPSTAENDSRRSRRAAKPAAATRATHLHKPVASSGGMTCSVLLAEPNVYLSGFDHHSRARRGDRPSGTALLRGKLQLIVSKNVKVKAVQLTLAGTTRTDWPEGIPPARMQEAEEESLRTQVLTFFSATHDGWETEYGNQCSFTMRDPVPTSTPAAYSADTPLRPFSVAPDSPPLISGHRGLSGSKDLKRLGFRSVRTRSFGHADDAARRPLDKISPSRKGYKIFRPGTYEYTFELPIDHHQLETTKLPWGSVKWELQATVERAGAFRHNLHGTKELSLVRLPDQLSLESTEPISIGRQWDDQLHYDIVISGKSFAIGSRIPVAFKFTPLAKVQVYKIRVYVSESIEYYTNDRRVTRREPGRKMLLMEKIAGKPLDPSFGADLRTTSGGELPEGDRWRPREGSGRLRGAEGEGREPMSNLLGDLELGLESLWGPTEIEANVQIPTCEMMRQDESMTLHPDSSWKNVNVNHFIKIAMRVSRADPKDPTGKKRRHFEISIDSPITLLDCRATQANTSLPQYTNPGIDASRPHAQRVCGCPDAATLPSVEDASRSAMQAGFGFLPTENAVTPGGSRRPRPYSAVEPMQFGRPIHLLRRPSFNPPAFDAEDPPPSAGEGPLVDANAEVGAGLDTSSILTPPPRYDSIVGTPSVDGLADYFARYTAHNTHAEAAIAEEVSVYDETLAGDPSLADDDDTLAGDHALADDEDDEEDEEDEDESDGDATTLGVLGRQRLTERTGRVNVVNPRTPGAGRVPSRSLEISRPAFVLSEPPPGRGR